MAAMPGIDDGVRRGSGLCREAACRLRAQCRSEPLPSRPLVVAAVCLATGCAAARGMPAAQGGSGAVVWWAAAVVAVVAWAWWAWRGREVPAAAVLCSAIFCAGAAWSAARFDLFPSDDLAWQLSDSPAPVAIKGTVVESLRLLPAPTQDPRRAAAIGPSSECVVAIEAIRAGSRWRPVSGRAAVIVDGAPPALPVGSRIRVLGRGLRPAPAFNPGEFDFRLRARSQRCLSIVRTHSGDCIRITEPPPIWSPSAAIDRCRDWGEGVLDAHLSPDRAPLAAALLLGSRESLPREDADDFLVTGTVHILSISGLHVGLLSLALFGLLRMLLVPRGWAVIAVAACTGLYMLLVRAETPVVRATLLVWLACLATAAGRRSPAINALAVAAIVVLACRPAEVFSAGAQLSFLSTAVLVGVAAALPRSRQPADPIDRLIERSRSPLERFVRGTGWQAWTLFVTGAAVWAATAPLVAARFHVVSPIGLVLNVLIAPLVALAMAWGCACLACATVSTTLAGWCGAACDATLAGIAGMVSCGAAVPGGHAWVSAPPVWWVAGWYGLLAAALLLLPRERLKRWTTWAAVAAAWIVAGVGWVGVATVAGSGPREMRAIVAAMGHGCGIVVRSPTGRCLVYDAGRLGAPGAARRAMAAVLWSEGLSRIDKLVVSHADTDHFNAVPELLARFAVGEIVVSESFLASPSPAVADLLERTAAAGIPVRTVRTGESFAVDPLCRTRVLHAGDGRPLAADNERSLVLAVEAAGRRLLLTGDLEGPALAAFVADGPDSCDVLVAPHHGSRTSLPADIARATAADVVLVSGVGGPSWPEVRDAYAMSAAKDATVLKTGGDGAIAVSFTAGGVAVSQYAAGRWRPAHD
jgi:competence protein ComEC